jgi:hypothetical protein
MAEAAVGKDGAAEYPDIGRCLQPGLRLGVELSDFLQLSLLFFRQRLNAQGGCHIDNIACRMQPFLLPSLLAFTVVTNISPAFRSFRRAIAKNVFARFFVMTDDIRFTASSFHFTERPEFFRIRIQLCLYFRPFQSLMAVPVFLKAGLQHPE